jgi:hypothetical protein
MNTWLKSYEEVNNMFGHSPLLSHRTEDSMSDHTRACSEAPSVASLAIPEVRSKWSCPQSSLSQTLKPT